MPINYLHNWKVTVLLEQRKCSQNSWEKVHLLNFLLMRFILGRRDYLSFVWDTPLCLIMWRRLSRFKANVCFKSAKNYVVPVGQIVIFYWGLTWWRVTSGWVGQSNLKLHKNAIDMVSIHWLLSVLYNWCRAFWFLLPILITWPRVFLS